MGTDPKKRQKKLERRAAKRKEKKHVLVREQNPGLAERLTAASKYPVLDCWIPDTLEEQGIGWVVLSRELPNGQVAAASFLVDSYCLGVKNVVAEVIGRSAYDSKYVRRMTTEMKSRAAAPAEARKLLEQSVAYARGLGLSPHADYARVMPIFGEVNSSESSAEFTFGKDGKPLFVAGPNDTPARCREVLAILNQNCGPDRFHYIMPIQAADLDDSLSRGEVRSLGADEDEGEDIGDK